MWGDFFLEFYGTINRPQAGIRRIGVPSDDAVVFKFVQGSCERGVGNAFDVGHSASESAITTFTSF